MFLYIFLNIEGVSSQTQLFSESLWFYKYIYVYILIGKLCFQNFIKNIGIPNCNYHPKIEIIN